MRINSKHKRLDCFGQAINKRERTKYGEALFAYDDEDVDWPELDGIVLLLFASRSGSTAFSRISEKYFGLSGVGESLNMPAIKERIKRLKTPNVTAEISRYVNQHSPHNWFMFKAGGPGVVNAERAGLILHYENVMRPVLLLREDIVEQSVSYVTAKITGKFHTTQTANKTVGENDYDFETLRTAVMTIMNSSQRLASYAQQFACAPSIVFYEAFKDGDQSAIFNCLDGIGIPRREVAAENVVQVQKLKKQASLSWISRFKEDMPKALSDQIEEYGRFISTLKNASIKA